MARHPIKRTSTPAPKEIAEAAQHLLVLAAAAERGTLEALSPETIRVAAKATELLLKHRGASAQGALLSKLPALHVAVSGAYLKMRSDPDLNVESLQGLLIKKLESLGVEPSDAVLDELVISEREIKELGGPEMAADATVGAVFGLKYRKAHDYRIGKARRDTGVRTRRLGLGLVDLLSFLLRGMESAYRSDPRAMSVLRRLRNELHEAVTPMPKR